MIENVMKNMMLKFIINYLTSLPTNYYKKMIDDDIDPKQIFLTLIETAPDYIFEMDEEAVKEIMEYVSKLNYKKLIQLIMENAPQWFQEMKDYILPNGKDKTRAIKTMKWFKKYIIRRLREWSETGTVKDLEDEINEILRKRGIPVDN